MNFIQEIKQNHGNIFINGKNVGKGTKLVIKDNKIFIDGKEWKEEKDANIFVFQVLVEGNLETLCVDECEKIEVKGTVGRVSTMAGNVSCDKILGSVKTMSGDVVVQEVQGSVSTLSGDIIQEKKGSEEMTKKNKVKDEILEEEEVLGQEERMDKAEKVLEKADKIEEAAKKEEVTIEEEMDGDNQGVLSPNDKGIVDKDLLNEIPLQNKYSQSLYKELLKYESTGCTVWSIKDLREKLGIPKHYSTTKIDQEIIATVQKEIGVVLENFKIRKKRDVKKIIGYRFSWTIKKQEEKKFDVNDIIHEKREMKEIGSYKIFPFEEKERYSTKEIALFFNVPIQKINGILRKNNSLLEKFCEEKVWYDYGFDIETGEVARLQKRKRYFLKEIFSSLWDFLEEPSTKDIFSQSPILSQDFFTSTEIAFLFDISLSQVSAWVKKHKDFLLVEECYKTRPLILRRGIVDQKLFSKEFLRRFIHIYEALKQPLKMR